MNVAGDANGIIIETRDSLHGFPGCSTNGYLVTPFCKGSAQQPAVSVILFFIITSASKHLKGCHAGLDPASSLLNGFRLSPE
jgi:hypothetical protein